MDGRRATNGGPLVVRVSVPAMKRWRALRANASARPMRKACSFLVLLSRRSDVAGDRGTLLSPLQRACSRVDLHTLAGQLLERSIGLVMESASAMQASAGTLVAMVAQVATEKQRG